MKTRKLIQKYFKAIFNKDAKKERKLYFKILRKSLRGKDTKVIK